MICLPFAIGLPFVIGKPGACLPAAAQLEIHGALPAAGGTIALRGRGPGGARSGPLSPLPTLSLSLHTHMHTDTHTHVHKHTGQLLEQLDGLCVRAPKLTTLTQLQHFLSAYAVRIAQEPKQSI